LDSEDEDGMSDIKSESRMDIAELKKEISDIIDEECVVRIYIMINNYCCFINHMLITFKGN